MEIHIPEILCLILVFYGTFPRNYASAQSEMRYRYKGKKNKVIRVPLCEKHDLLFWKPERKAF